MAYTERRDPSVEIPGDSPAVGELNQLFEQTSVATVAMDLDGRVSYCNPAFSRLTGYERESVLGTTPPLPWWSPEFPMQSAREDRLAVELYKTVLRKLVREAGVFAHPGVMYPREGMGFKTEVTIRGLVSASGVELGVVLEIRPEAELPVAVTAIASSPDWIRVRRLTPREREVFEHLRHGRRPSAIAQRLDVSDHTVRSHVKAIYKKLDIHSRRSFLDRF